MEKVINKIRDKARNCDTKTKEGRARKGAYVDCIIEMQQYEPTYNKK